MVNARGEKKEGLASSLRGLTRNSSKTPVNPSEGGGRREDLQVVSILGSSKGKQLAEPCPSGEHYQRKPPTVAELQGRRMGTNIQVLAQVWACAGLLTLPLLC